jgi:hypothetical protein
VFRHVRKCNRKQGLCRRKYKRAPLKLYGPSVKQDLYIVQSFGLKIAFSTNYFVRNNT